MGFAIYIPILPLSGRILASFAGRGRGFLKQLLKFKVGFALAALEGWSSLAPCAGWVGRWVGAGGWLCPLLCVQWETSVFTAISLFGLVTCAPDVGTSHRFLDLLCV